MPTPGTLRPIQRVPSGLLRPWRHRLQALRPGVLGRRVPPRVLPLHDDVERALRRRVDRLAGGDRERAHQPAAVEELQPVEAPVDHDHGPERRRRHRRGDRLRCATRTGVREPCCSAATTVAREDAPCRARRPDAVGRDVRPSLDERRPQRRRSSRSKRVPTRATQCAQRRPVDVDGQRQRGTARSRRASPWRPRAPRTRSRTLVGSSCSLVRSTIDGERLGERLLDGDDCVCGPQAADVDARDGTPFAGTTLPGDAPGRRGGDRRGRRGSRRRRRRRRSRRRRSRASSRRRRRRRRPVVVPVFRRRRRPTTSPQLRGRARTGREKVRASQRIQCSQRHPRVVRDNGIHAERDAARRTAAGSLVVQAKHGHVPRVRDPDDRRRAERVVQGQHRRPRAPEQQRHPDAASPRGRPRLRHGPRPAARAGSRPGTGRAGSRSRAAAPARGAPARASWPATSVEKSARSSRPCRRTAASASAS